ncbi:unnamed protein product [Rotaria sp. Silwood2]|nr:unnamed protein product [Rotaria sp. Silwood2]
MLYNKTRPKNIQSIDTILRENYEELIRIHCKQQLKCQINLLSKLDSSIDQEKLKDLIQYFECDTNEKIVSLDEMMLNHLNEIPKSFDMTTELSSDYKWFYQVICRLNRVNVGVVVLINRELLFKFPIIDIQEPNFKFILKLF